MKTRLLIIVSIICSTNFSFGQFSNGFQEISKLVSSDRGAGEEFGNAIDISGNYAVVADYKDSEDENGLNTLNHAGSVFVFEKQINGSWIQVQKLVNSDRAADDEFGYSVAIDGDYIVVGARSEDEDENGMNTITAAGSAYIFKRNMSSVWNEVQKVVPSQRSIALQWGWDVEIDGNYISIGTYRDGGDENGMNYLGNSGATYMFELNGSGVWVETQKIVASDRASNEWFAYDIDIDGDQMVIGAAGANHAGKAYIFNRDGSGVWNEAQILFPADIVSGSFFAESVSISGNYVAIGAKNENEDVGDNNIMNNAGAAYVFKNDNGLWIQHKKIVASDRSTSDYFGCEVGIDNRIIVVGAFSAQIEPNGTGAYAGATYIFELNSANNQWNELEKLVYADNAGADMFGEHVAISSNAVISSARSEDEDVNGMNTLSNSGSAYIFETCLSTVTTISPVTCDSYTSPSGNYVWTSSNTYLDTIQNVGGCDSVITINLTINSADNSVTQTGATLSANQSSATYQWVDCDNGNAPISGETNQTYTASANGNYAVEITTGNGCTATSTCYAVTGLSLNENSTSTNGIKLYPNPTNGNFTIKLGENNSKSTIQIIDLTGKVVFENTYSNQNQINLDLQAPKGIYFVKVMSNGQLSVVKLIKQ